MTTTVTRRMEINANEPVLYMALELADKTWKLAFTTGLGQKPRIRQVSGGDMAAVMEEVGRAKRRFRLLESTQVVCCYEAGMHGFWVHRALAALGVDNHVVDSSSIDTKRGRRRAKTDRLDAGALVTKLVQYVSGHHKIWSVIQVPDEDVEDLRHVTRELRRLRDEQTALRNAIKGLLKTQGVQLQRLSRDFAEHISDLRTWNGLPLRSELRARLLRMFERLQLVWQQIEAVETRREELLQEQTEETSAVAEKARRLLALRALGVNLSWTLASELYGWRKFSNRRQVGGFLGLVPVPYQSGEVSHDSGISKTGPTRLRATMIELAWLWIRYQPASALTLWFQRRYASGGKRLRRIGIVAVARKLAIELWKYVETGALPEGAELKA